MRTIEIPEFPAFLREPITDLGDFILSRLMDDVVRWPEHAVPLVAYMAWPNDRFAHARWLDAYQWAGRRSVADAPAPSILIQQHWARFADIFHHHYDLTQGGHQKSRGGPSIGKAICLVAAMAKSKGTGEAKLWEIWKEYKDVAHLVTASVVISAEAQFRYRVQFQYQAEDRRGHTSFRLKLHEFQPYRIAMLMPELVIAVAMSIETYGLQSVPHCGTESMFDPESLWRIPPDINLSPIELLTRKIPPAGIAILNARRAGNRGRANDNHKTTPVSA
jgi:hypothetical protein